MVTKTIDLQKTPVSMDELLALVKQDTLVVLTEGGQEIARVTPSIEAVADDVEARLKTFREAARDIGEVASRHIDDETEVVEIVKRVRHRRYHEKQATSNE